MKKLLVVLFGILFLASFAWAQGNIATVTQTGGNNTATTNQTGTNEVEILQEGNYQVSTASQTGDNFAGIYQLNNGENNQATAMQDGSGNEAWLNQGVDEDFWPDYESVEANWNTATVDQTGSSNLGVVEQYGGTSVNDGNEASLNQNGSSNTSYIYQGWAYSGWGETYETSHLKSTSSMVNVSQVNQGNKAYVWQYGGDQNEVEVTQNGNDNLTSVTQGFIYTDLNYTFTTPVYNTQENLTTITQNGDNNIGKVMQLGDNNTFKLSQQNGSQVGYDENAVGLEASRNAYFQQDGNDNQFAGVFKSGNDISFDGTADAEQLDGAKLEAGDEGISGYFGSFQKGDGNTIGLRQYNDNALIQQLGDYNTAVLWQDGVSENQATILQNGDSNTATVLQQP